MTRYRMDDDTIVDTDRADAKWKETTDWDGNNHISRATGSQWGHQTLYRSAKGRYYVEHVSQWQNVLPCAEWMTNREAALWLMHNDHELPQDLAAIENEVIE